METNGIRRCCLTQNRITEPAETQTGALGAGPALPVSAVGRVVAAGAPSAA